MKNNLYILETNESSECPRIAVNDADDVKNEGSDGKVLTMRNYRKTLGSNYLEQNYYGDWCNEQRC